VLFFLQMFVQLTEKSERVFNASSTLTPDSMMSDESQSRDWILPETASGCSAGTSNMADVPHKALESDVRKFSNISAKGVASCAPDNSTNKFECSDVTESPQMHNRCMLSGIDVSCLNSDANISLDSADVSAVAELNDARLSVADGDSSVNSTLKGSDADESCANHRDLEVNTFQPTFSVSIPIATMLETETNKDTNADVPNTDAKSPYSGCGGKPVMQAYSPISDADEETAVCQSPLHQPSAPSVNNRSATIAFSPISPFTPGPSDTDIAVPVVPLYWSCDVSSSAACDTSEWNISATAAEPADTGKTGHHHSDKFMSAAAAPVSLSSYFTFTPSSSSSHQSALGHGDLVRPTEMIARAGYCENASFEQQQQQHTSVFPHRAFQQPESGYPSMVSPQHHYLSRSQETCMQFTNCDSGSMSTQRLYSARSQRQDATQLSTVEARKYNENLPTTAVLGSKTENNRFNVLPCREERLAQKVKDIVHLPSLSSHARVNNCDNFDTSQTHHNVAGNTSLSSSNNGQFVYSFCWFCTKLFNKLCKVYFKFSDSVYPCP